MPSSLPAVIEYDTESPSSASVAVTVPTVSPTGASSLIEKLYEAWPNAGSPLHGAVVAGDSAPQPAAYVVPSP